VQQYLSGSTMFAAVEKCSRMLQQQKVCIPSSARHQVLRYFAIRNHFWQTLSEYRKRGCFLEVASYGTEVQGVAICCRWTRHVLE